MAFTIKGGKFSTTDDDRTIRQRPVDEVIDILDQIGQDDFTAQAMSRPPSAASPQVNVQQLKSLTPTYQGSNVPVGSLNTRFDDQRIDDIVMENLLNKAVGMEPTTTPYKSFIPAGPIGLQERYNLAGKVPSPSNMLSATGSNFSDFMSGDVNPGISSLQNISSGYPMKPDPGYEAALQKATPSGLGGIFQGILGSLTNSNPAVYMQTDEYGDPMGGGNYAVGRTFENPDTARRLGFIPVGRDAGGNIVYDVDPAVKASQERQDRDSRLDDERRERAAMLAAQQQQPVDPCPEGYRMDPVSKVCVPVDDTTEPKDPATRTYDTMTRPEPNYTPATGFTLPAITLPDIFS